MDARAHLVRLNEAKSDLEVEKTAPRVQRTEQPRAVPSDPVEAFLECCTAPTAKWLRAHPDEAKALALNDVRRGAKLNAAHSDALAEGLSADTPEYFGHVEKFLGMTKPNGKGNGHDVQRRSPAVPVAPVQASAGGTSGGVEVKDRGKGRGAKGDNRRDVGLELCGMQPG